ncbi:7TM chemoreceptor [Cinara cedri]|uniref:Gustatory receptor n=1 Tax=Cinara cedri TaxID=506608 RepID=A0A5E4NQ77_9HEMI|nr:7TM chemoreceptor [Cinara cedri]
MHVWAAMVYWTGKVAGVLVADTVKDRAGRLEYTTAGEGDGGRWRWFGARAWNAACLSAVAYRIVEETWPVTLLAVRRPRASCYDTVCGGVWCVYACVYYSVAWLDRVSETVALAAAVTWRLRSTVDCLNSAVTGSGYLWVGDTEEFSHRDLPWHVYLTVVFPVVRFATAAVNEIPAPRDYGVWRTATAALAAVASCSPVVAHGTAAALLAVANNSMRSINRRIAALHVTATVGRPLQGEGRLSEIARLARKHWWTTELVTGRVCAAYGVDLMAAVLLAVLHVTYVAVSVFHCLTDDADDRTNIVSVPVAMQLVGWFGQFAYLAYTCDDLANQSSEMFDNLNSLLLDIFKECRLSGETYSSRTQEIEAVQEFLRQAVARKAVVHACGGLIKLNLSLITTVMY